MKKTTALWSFTLLIILSVPPVGARAASSLRKPLELVPVRQWNASPQAAPAKEPQWKSREEYDAYNAMATERDANKRIALIEAFLQKFSNSDFKDGAYVAEMQAYQQLNQTDKAIGAAKNALQANPDSLDAIRFLSFVFPFVYKADDPEATSKLSRAESDAKHGLEILQKQQKPAGVSDEQFNQAIKGLRAIFNGTIGFVALQRKDYGAAITSSKAASEDNPSDWYTFFRMGLAYLYSAPRDYDHAVWYMARAVALARAAKDPNAQEFEKYLRQTYVGYHGNDQGLQDVVTQTAASPNPPEGFKVAPMETPKPTGNPNVDNFNTLTFPLKLGGEKAQKQWDQIKGQPFGVGGAIQSVEKGTDPGTYLVHIAILDSTKSTDGYDIELKDSTQPNVKNLQKGDLVVFKGTLDAYTATPNLYLTLSGTITQPDPLPDKPAVKEKPKPKPKTAPARRRTARKPPA